MFDTRTHEHAELRLLLGHTTLPGEPPNLKAGSRVLPCNGARLLQSDGPHFVLRARLTIVQASFDTKARYYPGLPSRDLDTILIR